MIRANEAEQTPVARERQDIYNRIRSLAIEVGIEVSENTRLSREYKRKFVDLIDEFPNVLFNECGLIFFDCCIETENGEESAEDFSVIVPIQSLAINILITHSLRQTLEIMVTTQQFVNYLYDLELEALRLKSTLGVLLENPDLNLPEPNASNDSRTERPSPISFARAIGIDEALENSDQIREVLERGGSVQMGRATAVTNEQVQERLNRGFSPVNFVPLGNAEFDDNEEDNVLFDDENYGF